MSDEADFKTASTTFLEWFKQQPGTTFHSSLRIADLRERNAGRGVIAIEDIPAETDLFTIPRSSIISTETSELAQKIPGLFTNGQASTDRSTEQDEELASEASETPHAWLNLILALLYELLHKDTSRWGAYLSILPEQSNDFNTLMFWNDKELSELQASAMSSKIGRASANQMFTDHVISVVRKNPDVFFPSSDEATHLNDEQLLQKCHVVGSLIMSYAFDLQPDEDDDDEEEPEAEDSSMPGWVEDKSKAPLMGMVPMADMLNADAEFNAHLSHGEDSLTMTSLREIRAGEEVLNYYGPLPNGELLRRYGYTSPKHTRYDVVEIGWDLVKQVISTHEPESLDKSSRKAAKMSAVRLLAAIEQDEDSEAKEGFLLDRDSGEPNEEGLCTSEAKFMKFPDELVEVITDIVSEMVKTDNKKRKLDDDAKRTMLKREALSIMSKIAAERLKQYSTTTEEDEMILSKPDTAARLKMAVDVRLGEKKLLKEALDWANEKQRNLVSSNGSSSGRQKKTKR